MRKLNERPSAKHPKVLLHKMQAIRNRVIYVCDFLFAGNLSRFAAALGLNYGHLHKALYDRAQVTTKMLAQIVSRTHVRAEWLLTGAGPMLATRANRAEPALQLPLKTQSVFDVFDMGLLSGAPIAAKKSTRSKRPPNTSVLAAAHVVHTCRVAGKPVCFFLGADAAADAEAKELAHEFFVRGYLTGVALTAGCLTHELTDDFDVNFSVKCSALHGVGLGEGLCRWGQKRNGSFFTAALNSKTPVTVHTELGEAALQLQPALRGAENGAAWGAAAYVDQLILAEQLHKFRGVHGGVCVILGEAERWLRVITQTAAVVRTALADEKFGTFHVLQLGGAARKTQEQVRSHGGRFYHMKGTYCAAAHKLLRACDDVFDGKVTHDTK